jgi:hypothetical protein
MTNKKTSFIKNYLVDMLAKRSIIRNVIVFPYSGVEQPGSSRG